MRKTFSATLDFADVGETIDDCHHIGGYQLKQMLYVPAIHIALLKQLQYV